MFNYMFCLLNIYHMLIICVSDKEASDKGACHIKGEKFYRSSLQRQHLSDLVFLHSPFFFPPFFERFFLIYGILFSIQKPTRR